MSEVCLRVQENALLHVAVLASHGNVPDCWQGLLTVIPLGREHQPTPLLDRLGGDLTERARRGELTPLIGRQKVLSRLLEILNQAQGVPNSVLLVFPPGVGKTALARGLGVEIVAGRVQPQFRSRRLVEVSAARL